MSNSGLQRRRGAKSTGDHTTESYDDSNTASPSNNNSTAKGDAEHKIGYDARDIVDRRSLNLPLLTLMEEVLLLGLKDKEGYLSFWNDNISYALRGCILLELTFRGKISLINDPARRRFELSDRLVEVIDAEPTGEVLLDEALKIMKSDESNLSVTNWIDLLSGETWNLMKITYQLKQVRERLAKGLVDKGVLRTERKNFFLFDMATHPVADGIPKDQIKSRVITLLTSKNVDIDLYATDSFGKDVSFKYLRTIAIICGAYAANVLENVFPLMHSGRDEAFARADELLNNFSEFPFNLAHRSPLGVGLNLGEEIEAEIEKSSASELQLELVAAVISVFARMDSIL